MGLELAITITLKQSADVDQRRCWCNSIVLPDKDALYLIEQILKTRQLIAKAWIDEGRGEDESLQHLYDMRLNFGDKAIDNLKTGGRMIISIPETLDSWITFDKENKTINVQLI